MKVKILNSWIICCFVFFTSLSAQTQSRVDARSEAPIEASVDKPDELEQKADEKQVTEQSTEKTQNQKPEKGDGDKVDKPENIYLVSAFNFSYGNEHPDLPPIEQLKDLEVFLNLKEGVYFEGGEGIVFTSGQMSEASPQDADSEDVTVVADTRVDDGAVTPLPEIKVPVVVRLGEIPPTSQFSEKALQQILTTIVGYFNNLDFYGVYAAFDRASIDPWTGRDKRKSSKTDLDIVVWASEVVQVRTIGKGVRFAPEKSIGNRKHRKILNNSPIVGRQDGEPGSLLSKSNVENYLQRLSRHPGRQVDAAISSSGEQGEVVLDFLVNENKPYILYAQVSNTGTESTGDWRERVGFIHHQLTNNDDILSIDFITAELDQTNSVLGSYQIPVIYPNYLKARAYGAWSEYDGDEVGITAVGFSGETTSFGFELTASPFIFEAFNLDILAGVRWADIEVNNRTNGIDGETQIWVPYLGIAMNRRNQLGSIDAALTIESNVDNIAASERGGSLGRLDLDPNWQVLKGNFHANFFLEPLIYGADWKDNSTWRSSTLAHELDFRFRTQYTLGEDRIIPQEQFIIGGFSSVRGYRESVASGDSGFIMNAEYRYHVPRALKPYSAMENSADPQEDQSRFLNNFNLRPLHVYGRPDWDLILRGFFDYGYTNVSDETFGESNLTLVSAGTGIELQILSNFNIRLDWGYILNTLKRDGTEIDDAEAGDSRFHFITTLSW